MKTIAGILVSMVMVLAAATEGAETKPEKPFERALILPGGGFNVSTFLGVAQALKDEGMPADLYIGTCGGSIAAVLLNLYPDDIDGAMEVVRSRDFYGIIFPMSFDPENNNAFNVARIAINRELQQWGLGFLRRNRHRAVLNNYLVRLPREIPLKNLDRTFRRNGGTACIVIGAKVLPKAGRRSVHELLFTDPETAKVIRERYPTSAIAAWGPDSYVNGEVFVRDDATLTFASRISVSDPFVFNLMMEDPAWDAKDWGRWKQPYYMGGLVNLYPFELADALAESTVGVFKRGDDNDWSALMDHYLNFEQNDRLRLMHGLSFDGIVDYTDEWSALGRNMPGFETTWLPWRFLSIPNQISYDEWLLMVEKGYRFGYERGREAARLRELPTRDRLAQARHKTEWNQVDSASFMGANERE